MMTHKYPLQRDCDTYYGNPRGRGGSVVSPSWYRDNMTTVPAPFGMWMGGSKITRIAAHKRCADDLAGWLDQVWRNAGRKQACIERWGMHVFSGAYNYRAMRGGTALSMHAYGCAWDFDAPRNGLSDRTPHFATLRNEVVKPLLALDGVWGGDWDGDGDSNDERRCDGMHFQFARLK